MKKSACTDLTEVFKTEHGVVYQCNIKNKLILEFSGSRTSFCISDFLDFIKRVNAINLVEMLRCTFRASDVAIITPHYTDRCFVLWARDLVRLKELLNGAKAMIHLNSMIHDCLRQHVATRN